MGMGECLAKTLHPARDLQRVRRVGIQWEVHAEPTKGAGARGRKDQDPPYSLS